jgi:hypothetical protein
MVSAHAWKFLEGARIVLGTSGIFPEKKREMFRSCRNHFGCFSLMKIIDLKMFWNMSRIILVGTGIILRPTEIFSVLTVTEKWFCE